MKELICPWHNFANSVQFYHHESRHTKVDNSIAFFPLDFKIFGQIVLFVLLLRILPSVTKIRRRLINATHSFI